MTKNELDGLPVYLQNALRSAAVDDGHEGSIVGWITQMTNAAFYRLPHLGPASLSTIKVWLASKGLFMESDAEYREKSPTPPNEIVHGGFRRLALTSDYDGGAAYKRPSPHEQYLVKQFPLVDFDIKLCAFAYVGHSGREDSEGDVTKAIERRSGRPRHVRSSGPCLSPCLPRVGWGSCWLSAQRTRSSS